MSEFHVVCVRVGPLAPHPNADRLLLARVWDYPVCVGIEEFIEGVLAVYVPVDALVPADDPRWEFLARGQTAKAHGIPGGRLYYRIRAAKLRGTFSMGLLTRAPDGAQEGDDCRAVLGIEKYEPPEPVSTSGEDERDPGILPVYDVEGLRRWPGVLVPGEEVAISEKLHGCVQARTRISMADGSRKAITGVSVGDELLGVRDGRVVASKVLQKFNNGEAERWLRVTGTRSGAGRGNSYFALFCTPEHRFWSPFTKAYVTADSLRPDDTVTLLRSELGLTPIQEQVLLGKMLGDGSLQDGAYSAHVSWTHRAEDASYGDWTERAVGELASGTREPATSGYGTAMLRWRTTNSAWVKDYLGGFFAAGGEKHVPGWVADALTPLALAFWYMDDGSLGHGSDGSEDKANFAVCAFTRNDCDTLIAGLRRLGIRDAVYYDADGYSRLRLNADDAERLFLLVAPYVPPSMQRKLPERYRGGTGWLPDAKQAYKPALVEQRILSVDVAPDEGYTIRHDMQTETGNYFANGVLVHNCNGRWAFHDGRLWVASHRTFKRPPGEGETGPVWWRAATQYGMEALSAFPGYAFYGEVYGPVQDLKYGTARGALKVAIFDVLDVVSRKWLDYDDAWQAADLVDLPWVPVLHRGPWSDDLRVLAEGPSTVPGADHVREGIVIRPVRERFHEGLGRVLLKLHGQSFLLRKSAP